MTFLCEISNEHSIFLFISFQLNMDLEAIEFVPYCDVFLSGTSSSSVFWFPECYRYGNHTSSNSNS